MFDFLKAQKGMDYREAAEYMGVSMESRVVESVVISEKTYKPMMPVPEEALKNQEITQILARLKNDPFFETGYQYRQMDGQFLFAIIRKKAKPGEKKKFNPLMYFDDGKWIDVKLLQSAFTTSKELEKRLIISPSERDDASIKVDHIVMAVELHDS